MMLVGVGMGAGATRYRRRTTRTVYACVRSAVKLLRVRSLSYTLIICMTARMKPCPRDVALEYWIASLLVLGAIIYGLACGIAVL
jgi:hypothetical protein